MENHFDCFKDDDDEENNSLKKSINRVQEEENVER